MDKYAYIILYTITVFFGILNYKKYWHNKILRIWFYFILYSFLTEIIGVYFIYFKKINANILYNSWFLASTIFYMFFFLTEIKNKTKRRTIEFLIAMFVLINLILGMNYLSFSGDVWRESFILGHILVVFTILLYYSEILNSEKIVNLKFSLFFWISVGVFIFNIGLLPVFVIAELIDWQGIFNYIILGVNIVLMLCFVTGFSISKKEFN